MSPLFLLVAVSSRPQPLRHLQLAVDRGRGGVPRVLRARASADSSLGFGGDAGTGPPRHDEQGGGEFSKIVKF